MYSIRYFELNKEGNNVLFDLNLGEERTVDSQMKYNDENICTKIKYLGCSGHRNYKKYLITCNKPVNISGYYKNEYIEYYITDENIEMYLSIDNAHMFIKGNMRLVKTALDDLTDAKIISFKEVKTNLSKLKECPEEMFIKGGSFKNTNITKVSSASIYGTSVDESELWEELDNVGTLSRIVFEFNTGNKPFSLAINEITNFTMYEKWNEDKSLERLYQLVTNVISGLFI